MDISVFLLRFFFYHKLYLHQNIEQRYRTLHRLQASGQIWVNSVWKLTLDSYFDEKRIYKLKCSTSIYNIYDDQKSQKDKPKYALMQSSLSEQIIF